MSNPMLMLIMISLAPLIQTPPWSIPLIAPRCDIHISRWFYWGLILQMLLGSRRGWELVDFCSSERQSVRFTSCCTICCHALTYSFILLSLSDLRLISFHLSLIWSYHQVWILGPGDVPTAAHELWEDDRMELLVIIIICHYKKI